MAPHQQRVVDEKTELDEKIGKLTVFLNGDVFLHLPMPEKGRLRRQLSLMSSYSDVLGERIAAF